jgi:hypothetical protein
MFHILWLSAACCNCSQAQLMSNRTIRLPAKFVKAHMPELAAVAQGSSTAIAVQLVMLPAGATDITAAAPAEQVLELPQGVFL